MEFNGGKDQRISAICIGVGMGALGLHAPKAFAINKCSLSLRKKIPLK